MHKKIIVIIVFMIFILGGCSKQKLINQDALDIEKCELSEEDKGIQIQLFIDYASLNISQGDILAYGIVYEMNSVESADMITVLDVTIEKTAEDNNPFNFIIDNIDQTNYTTPYSFRAYLKCLDKDHHEVIVYSNTYQQVTLYDLAKNDLSSFAHEIIKVVEGIDIVDLVIDFDKFLISTGSNEYNAQMRYENKMIIVTVTSNANYHFADAINFTMNGNIIDKDKYVKSKDVITYIFNDPRPQDYVTVSVFFQLNDGCWNSDIFKDFTPQQQLLVTALNDDTGTSCTIIDQHDSTFRWFYKIFIKYDEDIKAYKVVALDNATMSINEINVPDYDYVIGVHDACTNEEAKTIIRSYASSASTEGMYLLFSSNLSQYQSGNVTVSFYSLGLISNSWKGDYNESVELPVPFQNEYLFVGWSDGNNIYKVFPRYTLFQHISQVTYTAIWEPLTMEDFDKKMNDIIPDIINDDLQLPTSFSTYTVIWDSNHHEVISNIGEYTKPYENMLITLKARIFNHNDSRIFTYEVRANGYKKLTLGIASSYIFRNYSEVTSAFFDTLDIINCGFINVNPDATLTGNTFLNNVRRYIIPKAHEKGDWVIMTAATSELEWSKIAQSTTLINQLADNIVNMINEIGFDGVDIDWECPLVSQKTDFTRMMSVIYQKVKANNPHHLVTAAIGGGKWQPPLYDLSNSQQYLDYINLMTYSMSSSNGYYQNALFKRLTYHNEFLKVGKTLPYCSIDESIAFCKENYHLPNEKIIVGVAFYGRKQVLSDSNTWDSAESLNYHDIVNNYLNTDNYLEYYDEISCVPYILNKDGTVFITYDNPTSIKAKCAYVLDKGIGGVMYWENGMDLTGTLLQAIKESLNK